MSGRLSLSFRLAAFLLAALLAADFAIWFGDYAAALGGFGRYSANLDDMAEARTRALILASLARGPDDQALIEPNAELSALRARTPSLRYAVFNPAKGELLRGSSPELFEIFSAWRPKETAWLSMRFKRPDGNEQEPEGVLQTESTRFGAMLVATYGYRFEWRNVSDTLLWGLQDTLRWQGPVYAFAALVIWLAVRRGLAPLRAAARKARDIDMDSLNQRLPEGAMPIEVSPFVRAVNDALTRLDAGVARQRRFVANAAHQLCTPIAILRARVDDPDGESLRRDLRRDLRHLQALVEKLLVSARFEAAGRESWETLDFNALVREKLADYAPLICENGRHIEFDGASAPILTRGDRRALGSIVANLVDNALRAEPEGGTVIVRLARGAALAVEDHGAGVAPADRSKIFEPFWRGSQATPGAGLGLAIAKELVEKLHGRIWVEDMPGGGATFKLSFPEVENS